MLDNEKQIKHVVSTYLGFTEDNICIWGWAFVYVWFVDYKENIFWLSDGHSWDSWHLLQSKFRHGFSGFLLTSALLSLSTRFTSLNTRTSVISIMAHKSNVWTKKDNELVYDVSQLYLSVSYWVLLQLLSAININFLKYYYTNTFVKSRHKTIIFLYFPFDIFFQ